LDGIQTIAENRIREAIENGVFDHLPGMGKPLDLDRAPFEDPLAPTFRRILRDNGATHPLIEARRALEQEIESCRSELRTGRRVYEQRGGSEIWDQAVQRFRVRVTALNRDIKLNNLRSPIANFALHTLDADAELRLCQQESG